MTVSEKALSVSTVFSRASAPVKASIHAVDILSFTGGACPGDYGMFLKIKPTSTTYRNFPRKRPLVKASISRLKMLAFTGCVCSGD